MRPTRPRFEAAERSPTEETARLGTPVHERLMMLELAADLQSWPARNIVFQRALDRAAQDLARMASDVEAG